MEPSKTSLPLELVDEAEMPGELDRAIRRLLCECFPKDADVYSTTRAWHGSIPTWSVVRRDGEQIVGHVTIFLRTITCGQQPVTVAGVGNFCVAQPWRGTGLSRQLLHRALEEAPRRGTSFGLLFCTPALERLYASFGWTRIDEPITMLDDAGRDAPIPAANIGMFVELGEKAFPPGPIHLRGSDW